MRNLQESILAGRKAAIESSKNTIKNKYFDDLVRAMSHVAVTVTDEGREMKIPLKYRNRIHKLLTEIGLYDHIVCAESLASSSRTNVYVRPYIAYYDVINLDVRENTTDIDIHIKIIDDIRVGEIDFTQLVSGFKDALGENCSIGTMYDGTRYAQFDFNRPLKYIYV